ncbi:MAG TPA: histidine phosphatase family protein [Bacteroidia bacterium]|jgi:phosphohistidine phosphatase|nr:histidine phosphatase family protein [Bacteroidia bacterium]
MKTLYLVRHAKASWEDNVHDWERQLTEAGVERAHIVAKILKAKKIKIDKIISSYAFRALNTAVLFALDLKYPITSIELSKEVYEKRAIDMLDMLRKQDDKNSSIMLVGHDPGITELYNMLTKKLLLKLTTASAACIEFPIDKWKDLGSKQGKSLFIESGK